MSKQQARFRLKHRDGRLWKIEITGRSFSTELYTRTSLTGDDKTFPDPKACRKEAIRLIKDQLQQGYKEIKLKEVDKKLRPKIPKLLKEIFKNEEIRKKKSIKINQFIELKEFEINDDLVIKRFPEEDEFLWKFFEGGPINVNKFKSDFIPFIKNNCNDSESLMVFGIFSSQKEKRFPVYYGGYFTDWAFEKISDSLQEFIYQYLQPDDSTNSGDTQSIDRTNNK